MSQAAYSDLKAAWHTDRINDMRKGKPIAPVELQLIISDFCNHDCHFCAYRASNGLSVEQFAEDGNPNPNRMLTLEKASQILEDAASCGVKSVIFTGGGEPTVHPHHMELFKQALDLGMECSLNTNGAILRKGWEDVLPRFTYVRFSIDAGTAEEYAEVRKVKPQIYWKVLRNLKDLVQATDGTDCIVGAGYVVAPTSCNHLLEGVQKIKETGASYVRLASMQSTDGVNPYLSVMYGHDNSLKKARDAISEAKELEDWSFSVIDLFDTAMGNKVDYKPCGFQHFVVYVGANQKVYRCCYKAYTKIGECGDLTNQRFSDWLYSPAAIKDRKEFDARSCVVCPLDHKNRVINYLTQENPVHVNFV